MKPIIVINSHISSNIALNHAIESITKINGYSEYKYIIFIGGYYKLKHYKLSKIKNFTYVKCNHNSIDFTGLIGLYELYNKTQNIYLYLHDTIKVGEMFFEKIKNIPLENISSIKINKVASMNIGFYSQEIINNNSVFLLNAKNLSKELELEFKLRAIKSEDFLFKNDKNNLTLDNFRLSDDIRKPLDYYNTGTMRIIEYYPNLDLYKIKANHGRSRGLILSN